MKAKLDIDSPPYPYRILGACNPPLAHRAIQADPDIGLLLPCNVIDCEGAADNIIISFMDPTTILPLADRPGIDELAQEVKQRLEQVRDGLTA